MVSPDVASRKVSSATARLADVDGILEHGRKALLTDIKDRDLATFTFADAAEAAAQALS